jgi:hypothetical protein
MTRSILAALAVLALLQGCETIAPDAITLDTAHVSHHYGSPGPDNGFDSGGIGEHWKTGPITVDLAQYGRDAKNGWSPEFSARASVAVWQK